MPQLLRDVPLDATDRRPTGIDELDRVLGGGLVPGSVVLLGGEPGIGKSTLLLQAAATLAATGRTLYLSAEESIGQIRLRAERLGAMDGDLLVAAETTLAGVLALVERVRPDLVILDSIQTIADVDRDAAAGSVTQVRECAAALSRLAKAQGIATVLVGHVTKEGAVAGPRTLEHLVDAVLLFEGEPHHALRLLRGVKNRYGPTGEVGCFEMTGVGLVAVTDASAHFLDGQTAGEAGVATTVTLEGPRPLAIEVQALAVGSTLASPRRQTTGLDASRVAVLAAVLERKASVKLRDRDLFASAVGGMRVTEPAADLALCLAVSSSVSAVAPPAGTVAIGEVGLAGEVRPVPQLDRRLAEAARLGLSTALVPARYAGPTAGLEIVPIADVRDAVRLTNSGRAAMV